MGRARQLRLRIVALLAEGVDRNILTMRSAIFALVALLAEGVDRNIADFYFMCKTTVALLAEGVDRNDVRSGKKYRKGVSPSSRRAWIEMRMVKTLRIM